MIPLKSLPQGGLLDLKGGDRLLGGKNWEGNLSLFYSVFIVVFTTSEQGRIGKS